ncbi:MAG: response regulator [Gemmataceae bacterium]|nr:response regulator [Gemmataceae bacterium]
MTALQPRPATVGRLTATRLPAVLVVDDDDTLRTVLARELRRRGFDVHSAGSGVAAVETYRRLGGRIDLALLDVNMPGMTGPDVLAALRTIDPLVRCCFMTADVRPETRSALREAGGREVLAKPFASLAEVCETLKRLAGGSRGDGRETVGGEYAGLGSARRLHDEGD